MKAQIGRSNSAAIAGATDNAMKVATTTAVALAMLVCVVGSDLSQAQIRSCDSNPKPAFCTAVRGDRAEGWIPQTRSEVVARNGMVATSQALAAEAGMDILKQGGNAIDAASLRRRC